MSIILGIASLVWIFVLLFFRSMAALGPVVAPTQAVEQALAGRGFVFTDGPGYDGMAERRATDLYGNAVRLLTRENQIAEAQVLSHVHDDDGLAALVTSLLVEQERDVALDWIDYQLRALSAPDAAFERSATVGGAHLRISGRRGGFSYRIALP